MPINNKDQYVLSGPQGFIQRAKPTSKYGSTISVIGPDDVPLPTNEYGHYLDKDHLPLPTNIDGYLINSNGLPLPINSLGEVHVNDNFNNRILPTDDTGKFIYPIVYKDGTPLKTDLSGNYVDLHGELLITDDFGRPLDENGNLRPTNNYGQYIYSKTKQPVVPSNTILKNSDFSLSKHSSTKKIVVVNSDGIPMATDANGNFLDHLDIPYPTNSNGDLVSLDGSPLPTNSNGAFIILDEDELFAKTLPTDDYGKQIYPVVNEEGMLLSTDFYGRHLDPMGEPISTDEFGRPVNDEGTTLKINNKEQYIFPNPNSDLKIDQLKKPYATNNYGLLVSADGSPLPTNSNGKYVVINQPDEKENLKKIDNYLSTDDYGKVIYPIIRPDGNLLAKSERGRFVDAHGEIIPTDDFGRPIDKNGQILPTNSVGNFVYFEATKLGDNYELLSTKSTSDLDLTTNKKILPTNSYQIAPDANLPLNKMRKSYYTIVNNMGRTLNKTSNGRFVDEEGNLILLDDMGQPVNKNGKLFPKDLNGNFVYFSEDENNKNNKNDKTVTLPTDNYGKLVYPFVNSDGQLLPKNEYSQIIDVHGNIIPVNTLGRPISIDKKSGKPLPTNVNGNYVYESYVNTQPIIEVPDKNMLNKR